MRKSVRNKGKLICGVKVDRNNVFNPLKFEFLLVVWRVTKLLIVQRRSKSCFHNRSPLQYEGDIHRKFIVNRLFVCLAGLLDRLRSARFARCFRIAAWCAPLSLSNSRDAA